MKFVTIDSETDGLYEECTKIHVLSYEKYDNDKLVDSGSIIDYKEMVLFLISHDNFVGHNIVKFDIPVFEKILGVDLSDKMCIDTLALLYYLYPYANKYNLEHWMNKLNIEKPKIDDWINNDLDIYVHRCEQDVRGNSAVFLKIIMPYILELYENDAEKILNMFSYFQEKQKSMFDQEREKIFLDKYKTKKTLLELENIYYEKYEILSNVMPDEVGKIIKEKPKVPYKQDGTLSHYGKKWFELLKKEGLPKNTEVIRDKPNPNSHVQLKEWLFKIGWDPCTYKTSKNTGEEIPQVTELNASDLTESVKLLFDVEPDLKELEDFYVIKHRVGVFKGFLESVNEKGYITSTSLGYTNTLRVKHVKPTANLPKPGKVYAEEIRNVMVVPNDSYIMCGSDISGLEDKTKQHYIYFFDPEYVEEMQSDDFDPHLDMGLLLGLVTEEEEKFYKKIDSIEDKSTVSVEDLKKYNNISDKRYKSKTGNFCMTYKAYPPKISKVINSSLEEAQRFFDTYWERNKAIIDIEKSAKIKKVYGQLWVYNPIAKMYYFLKKEKDLFSTLNQGTGSFVFDTWKNKVRKKLKKYRIRLCLEYHDELLLYFKHRYKKIVRKILKESMEETNKELKLNVNIGISIDFGNSYKNCH